MSMIRKVFVLLITIVILASCLCFGVFSDDAVTVFDSFEVKEEYREIVESVDLIGMMKYNFSELDVSGEYVVWYDSIITEFKTKNNNFSNLLAKGKILFREADFVSYPILYVPIVDSETSLAIMYAKVIYDNGRYEISWISYQGSVLVKENLDAKFGASSSYVFVNIGEKKFLYCEKSGSFYLYNESFSINEKYSYTPENVAEFIKEEGREGLWIFIMFLIVPIVIGSILLTLTFVVIPLITVKVIRYIIRRRRKKKALQEQPASSDA